MIRTIGRFPPTGIAAGAACLLALLTGNSHPRAVKAQAAPAAADAVPDLSGVWDGTRRAHPINGPNVPWAKSLPEGTMLPDGTLAGKNYVSNFPELNERGLAFQKIFDEPLSPKYDCQPSTPPALEYDPFFMEVVQWPDRVMLRYEKDDQLRTVWLDGRQPTAHDYGIQGLSVGRYENRALLVETSMYVFDVTGFDDYNGIPSSQQKKVKERYWREGEQLKATVTVEDPMFLRKPASYTMRWLPAPKGYKLKPFDCDPEAARLSVQFIPPRYK
ncbi:MAG TPA: hypothetical protein VKE51_43360 [Vicinamibacterales bacterium]|nr:hypothetical protein [Vicinamibacterales bacterium]